MSQYLFKNIAIVGVGLIGGSLGLAIKKKKIAKKVIGIGHRKQSIRQALRQRVIDEGYLDLRNIKDADLVILATPVSQIMSMLATLSQYVSKGSLVVDVGSTKSEIIRIAERSGLEFIGCHPLAGMEKTGVQNAKDDLFAGSLCLVVPTKNTQKESLRKIQRFWKTLGARAEALDAASHDRILAFVSHLPHAAAFGLIDCIKPAYLRYAAGGLKDTTRIGLSDSRLWRDIFLTNRKACVQAIKSFKQSLARLEFLIKTNQPKALASYLERARNKRNGF